MLKRMVYGLVGGVCVIIIANWCIVNYMAFQDSKRATEATVQAVSADSGKTEFAQCSGQWPNNAPIQAICNESALEGYRQFSKAWWSRPNTTVGLQLVACFRGSQTMWGTNWFTAGSCAQLYS